MQQVREYEQAGIDLLELPLLGRFLKWKPGKWILQGILLAGAVVLILHGFFGPRLAPKNLATLLSWVHYRGLLVFVLLVAGNFFCMACPFMLPRNVARSFFKPKWNWPRKLRNKWIGIGLFVAILFAYELFDLWGNPWWTAWLIVGYFAGALLVDGAFKNATFCKYVCPIGQFNFTASTLSPFEVRVRDPQVCASCKTVDCIRGTRHPEEPSLVLQRGCELALFQPEKVGNLDCTFCLDCVYACPHDNVGILSRLPATELGTDERRSGIGRLSKRKDLSALALIFTFGALLNAFGMISPVYVVEQALSDLLVIRTEAPILAILFVFMLIVEPLILLGGATIVTRWLTGSTERLLALGAQYAYALIPLGLGVWAAHYSFHLLTGLWTPLPVIAGLLAGGSGFMMLPFPPGLSEGAVYPIELGLLGLGAFGSLLVSYMTSVRLFPERPIRAFVPWGVVTLLLWAAAMWMLSQPMEMRGTFLGG